MVLILSRNTLCNPFFCKWRVHSSGENYMVGYVTVLPPAFKTEYILQLLAEQLELFIVAIPSCTAGYKTPVFCLTDVPAAVSVKGDTRVLLVRQEGLWAPCKKEQWGVS